MEPPFSDVLPPSSVIPRLTRDLWSLKLACHDGRWRIKSAMTGLDKKLFLGYFVIGRTQAEESLIDRWTIKCLGCSFLKLSYETYNTSY
ncbi:hypothetical protein [Parabacteroides pacaensis]|uniref:hypothetical protein n=1 Tax=Parabacteroides pacaensis TaxID=2086575 RepID=UPI00131A61AF|nr:hypothetical protein [Parabacteroides pacaensis]